MTTSFPATVIPDPFADLRSPEGSLVSLYVSRPSPGGFTALITDLLRPIRDQAAPRGRGVDMSVRADAERIRALADRFESEAAPAYAVFASSADGIFSVGALPFEVPDVSVLSHRPYLRPLRAAPRPLRAGVLVADRTTARVFVASGAVIDELGGVMEAEPTKRDFGGFAGYDERTARQRADESASRLWKEAGHRLLDAHQERRFDFVALGGQEEVVEGVARLLHPYLARLPRVVFPAVPATLSTAALRAEVSGAEADVRSLREEALAGRVCDVAWSGGLAVLGLGPTLDAASAQAVETLVVAGGFTRSGATCLRCGHLTRSGESCPVCGSPMAVVDDVVAALMEAVVAAGGSVHQIEVASPLDNDGVGAMVRFPVGG